MRKFKIDHQNLEIDNRYIVATKSWQLTNIEIIALMKTVQLKESLVNDAIDAPKIKVTDCINGQLMKHKTQLHTAFRSKW
jgi:hypothetical protein